MTQVTATLDEGTKVTLSNGRHEWTADEPVAVGGTDTGPDPYELLMSSLAACTSATIALYCQHKGLALKSVRATFDFSRVHADDYIDCDSADNGLIEKITSNIHIEGHFDKAQKKRLAQVASRCPVHKTLENGVSIEENTTFGL